MATQPNLEIALCSDADIPTCFQVLSRGFGHDAPFLDAHFPNHDTEFGQAQGIKRLLAWKKASEGSSFFLKAVARDSVQQERDRGTISGFAIWTHMKTPPSPNIEDIENVAEVWPNAHDAEFMRRMWREYVVPRSEAVMESNGAGIYVLEMLAVDRQRQRQGAGTALVSWGTRAADEQGLVAIVESTPAGRRTYEKCGLRVEIERMRFEVGEGFQDKIIPWVLFMKRPAKALQ